MFTEFMRRDLEEKSKDSQKKNKIKLNVRQLGQSQNGYSAAIGTPLNTQKATLGLRVKLSSVGTGSPHDIEKHQFKVINSRCGVWKKIHCLRSGLWLLNIGC